MAARALTDLEKSIERAKIPHKGLDVVSLRINNMHTCYVCYHCLNRRIAEIQDGDDTIDVQIWKAPRWALDKSMICLYWDQSRESR